MNILIAYAGKTGTTKKCAEILKNKLENVTIINLDEQDINVQNYDFVIIGSSVRMGMLHHAVRMFIKKNDDRLKSKKTAYFICCGFDTNYKDYFIKNISEELLQSAIIYDTFGGELDVTKQKGFSKFIVKMISKTEDGKKEIKILDKKIDNFVEVVKSNI